MTVGEAGWVRAWPPDGTLRVSTIAIAANLMTNDCFRGWYPWCSGFKAA